MNIIVFPIKSIANRTLLMDILQSPKLTFEVNMQEHYLTTNMMRTLVIFATTADEAIIKL